MKCLHKYNMFTDSKLVMKYSILTNSKYSGAYGQGLTVKCLHKYYIFTYSKLGMKCHKYSIQYINIFVMQMGHGLG